MKFTLSWLRDHLETEASPAAIADALTDLGLEVEAITDPSARLGAFRICKVIEAAPHPDADRLRVCRVATWPDGPGSAMEEVQVVCGAPNARTGMVGVFAPPGTHVPGTGVDLKPGVIRGVASNGMLCSERELELSDDHDGIIELPADAPLGARFIDWAGLDDPVIEIKLTPNRPDALGVRGIARDLAARGLGRLKPLAIEPVAGSFSCPVGVSIAPRFRARGCSHFAGRMIRGLRNGPSPEWLQRRLTAIGLRPVSAVVDITNFFCVGLNRPLHAFDADRLSGDLLVREGREGEEYLAINGHRYGLAGRMVIADDNGPQSLAGIMGGEETSCTHETTSIFLESAMWDAVTVATAGRALRVHSDARYRFERGADPAFTLPGLELATRMILDLCGGEASEVVQDGEAVIDRRAYRLDPRRIRTLVGMDVPAAEQRRTLEALGFRFEGDMAIPPSWRPDVLGEADLIEEIARVASLSRLTAAPLPRPAAGVTRPVLTQAQRQEKAARRTLAALGYNECLTYSFISQGAAARFGGGTEALRVENPISSEMTHLRPDLLPGLLSAAARNQARGLGDIALFEIGPVFTGGEPGAQDVQAAGLLVGATAPRDPHGSRRNVDVFDARADAEAVLAALGAPNRAQVARKAPDWFHPGRSGTITLGPALLAAFGELHPRILAAFGIRGPAVAFTVTPAAVPAARRRGPTRPALTISDLPAVERDFAFVIGAEVAAQTAVMAARGADKQLIESVRVFDEFTGPRAEAQLGAGLKSLALTVRLQPGERTLTEAEIEAVSARIVAKVIKATGGSLRS